MEKNNQKFSIFHFNDVYDIQQGQKQPKGGVAWFKSLLDRQRQHIQHKLTLFSGDAFSPSLLSTQYQGQNMIKPLNSFGIDAACIGNHDLDYPIDHAKKLKQKTNFPWLLSNMYDKRTQRRLLDAEQYKIIYINGLKIGIFSLAQKQWIDTLIIQYQDICQYLPFISIAEQMVHTLKNQQCDIIIALTHMMKYNDLKLAENVNGIDLILGGHDHSIVHQIVKNSVIIKSGTNFRHFSKIAVYVKNNEALETKQLNNNKFIFSNEKWKFEITLYQVHHEKEQIIPDPELNQYVNQLYADFEIKQKRVSMYTKTELDLRFKTIRMLPSSFLQFLATFYGFYCKSDCGFMNGGNFRADCRIHQGPITFGTLTHTIQDNVVAKLVNGEGIIQCLENCVSMYPNLSGRYSSLFNLSFIWDCAKQPYQRVLRQTVKVNGNPIQLDKIYRVSMHEFMSQGGDGFFCIKDFPYTQDIPHLMNKIILHELDKPHESKLVKEFIKLYPHLISIIEREQHKYIELHLPQPTNIIMINSKK